MHHRDLDLEFEGGEYVTLIPLKPDIITGAYKEYYILKEEELQERDERIAREAFKAGQINGIRIGFENAKESEWRKEEGGEYLRDKYESVEDLLKEVE